MDSARASPNDRCAMRGPPLPESRAAYVTEIDGCRPECAPTPRRRAIQVDDPLNPGKISVCPRSGRWPRLCSVFHRYIHPPPSCGFGVSSSRRMPLPLIHRPPTHDRPAVTMSMIQHDILKSSSLKQLSGLLLPVVLGIGRVKLVLDDEIALLTGKSTNDLGHVTMQGQRNTPRRRDI